MNPPNSLWTPREVSVVASARQLRALPAPAFPEVAFAGRSNVGKSSLINSLIARKRLVRTSATPGCTRSLNLVRVRFPDVVFDLVDLPGYGFAKRSKSERAQWGELIERFLTSRPALRAVVLIVDLRRGLEEDDEQLVDFLRSYQREVVLVATKVDKLNRSERDKALRSLKERAAPLNVLLYSSKTGEGREVLWQKLADLAGIRRDNASA